ncbi:hypothetical protein EON63_03595, partial [archaeon]
MQATSGLVLSILGPIKDFSVILTSPFIFNSPITSIQVQYKGVTKCVMIAIYRRNIYNTTSYILYICSNTHIALYTYIGTCIAHTHAHNPYTYTQRISMFTGVRVFNNTNGFGSVSHTQGMVQRGERI